MPGCGHVGARALATAGPRREGAEDNELIRRVLSRKTVRRYSDKMPGEELLDLLIACALSASAKSDFQQASILRVRDPEKRAAIGALFPGMPWIGIAPVFFVFLGDARRLQRIGELRGKPVDNATLEGFFNASIDAALAMQTMILCAESSGLGVCPISVIRNEVDKVADILALPDLVFPVAGLCLGYPQGEGHVSLRLPRGVTTHIDRYDDQHAGGGDRRLRPQARCGPCHPKGPAAVQCGVRRGRLLRLVRRQGAPGRQGRRRGVPALSAISRI